LYFTGTFAIAAGTEVTLGVINEEDIVRVPLDETRTLVPELHFIVFC
jgi:hypothetical protein